MEAKSSVRLGCSMRDGGDSSSVCPVPVSRLASRRRLVEHTDRRVGLSTIVLPSPVFECVHGLSERLPFYRSSPHSR